MKVFFDTNVYVAEAILGDFAEHYLVTNDGHLLALDPYEGLRIVSMNVSHQLLRDEGHLRE